MTAKDKYDQVRCCREIKWTEDWVEISEVVTNNFYKSNCKRAGEIQEGNEEEGKNWAALEQYLSLNIFHIF